MALFGNKKDKKSPEELRKEREEKVKSTSNTLRVQILALEKKKNILLGKVADARARGLAEQERQARGLLKQTMASIKRQEGMLMQLELAVEARDLAQLNVNFLESIGNLSDDILATGVDMSPKKVKAANNKFLHAMYESNRQKDAIDEMLDSGNYASALSSESADQYSEFDDEIDSLLNSGVGSTVINGGNKQRF